MQRIKKSMAGSTPYRVQVLLSGAELQVVRAYQRAHHIASESRAIREIVAAWSQAETDRLLASVGE